MSSIDLSKSVNLFHGDCLEVMKDIPDGSVDLILTDPPYKVTSRGGRTSAGGMLLDNSVRSGKVFKENNIAIEDWIQILHSKLKDKAHCYIMCNNKNLPYFLRVIERSEFSLVKTMVWAKNNKIMSQAYMSQTEFILFLRKGGFKRINNCGSSDLMMYDNPKNKLHPTEKPVELLENLIENSSDSGNIVLDPFMGSGSAGVACLNTNRKFIGIELDPEYFEIASKRIKEAQENV